MAEVGGAAEEAGGADGFNNFEAIQVTADSNSMDLEDEPA